MTDSLVYDVHARSLKSAIFVLKSMQEVIIIEDNIYRDFNKSPNYKRIIQFVDAVGMLREKKITIWKLKQFQTWQSIHNCCKKNVHAKIRIWVGQVNVRS